MVCGGAVVWWFFGCLGFGVLVRGGEWFRGGIVGNYAAGGGHCGRGRVGVGRPLDDVLPTAGDRVDMTIEDGCAFWKGRWVWTL